MAPEVALGLPYNELCDVYSFSLLLWELLSLQKPYPNLSPASMRESVWHDASPERPRIHSTTWPMSIQDLLQRGWSPILSKRPPMNTITLLLGNVYSWMQHLDGEEESKLDYYSDHHLHTSPLLTPPTMSSGKSTSLPPLCLLESTTCYAV